MFVSVLLIRNILLRIVMAMDSSRELPVYTGPVDHLRHGFRSLESEFVAPHPVQRLQTASANSGAWVRKLDTVRRIYGSHMAMRLATEKETFSRNRRLPGLESSNIALQTLMGTDETVDFQDFLNGIFMHSLSYLFSV